MSCKNLSRTVIEGGRYYSNCYFRRASHGDERASTREWLDRVAEDLEAADATAPRPLRRVPKHFRDKLAPAQRWLAAQVGRPWDKVYADLCTLFDTRTVAGRHVVNDHMLGWVRRHDERHHRYTSRHDLVIDAHGILRKPKLPRGISPRAWANGRVVANTYRGWWWFRRVPVGKACPTPWTCKHRHEHVDGRYYTTFGWRPEGALGRAERRYLAELPEYLRWSLVIPSPW